MNLMPIQKMTPLPPNANPELQLYRGIPAAVQDLQYRSGSLEVVLFWSAPQSMLGVDKWRIFQDNENNLIQQIDDRNARQVTIKMPGNSSAMFYVCAVSEFKREGPKRSVLAKTTTDQIVTSGTTGATSGSSSTPDSEWTQQPSGGNYRGRIATFNTL